MKSPDLYKGMSRTFFFLRRRRGFSSRHPAHSHHRRSLVGCRGSGLFHLLRTLRKGRGWTQVYMAEHIGMDRSFISDLENGKKEICIRNLDLIATAFDLTVSKLLARL